MGTPLWSWSLVIHNAHLLIKQCEKFCYKKASLIWLSPAFSDITEYSTPLTGFSEHIQKHWSSPTPNTQQNQNDVPDPPTIDTAFFQYITPNALNSAGEDHYINLNAGIVKHPRQLELQTSMRSAHIWSVSEPPGAGYPWLLPPPQPSQEEEQR